MNATSLTSISSKSPFSLNIFLIFSVLLTIQLQTKAAFTFDDIDFWVDHSSTENASSFSSAALVIDWNDGQGAMAWGFRWDSTVQNLTQDDVLAAIALTDPRFSYETLYGGSYLSNFLYDPGDGGTVRSAEEFVEYDPYQGDSWFLHSNLEINDTGTGFKDPHELTGAPWAPGNDPRDFLLLTPVGFFDVPVIDGMWSYWAYSYWSENGDYLPSNVPWTEPTAVSVIPEPTVTTLLMMAGVLLINRRRRNSCHS